VDISSTTARSSDVFATHSVTTFASVVNWALFLAVHSMIVVGILIVLFKSQKAKLDPTYRILLIMSSVVLFLSLAVPNIAPALNFSRFYQLSILFLAPCFVLGGQALAECCTKLLRRLKWQSLTWNANKIGTVLVCAVLIGYFFSQSGFINCVTKAAPLSYSLDFSRYIATQDLSFKASFYSAYIPEQNFYSASWSSKYLQPQSTVFADSASRMTSLLGYGILLMNYLPLYNTTIPKRNNFVYLSELNIENAVITVGEPPKAGFNASEISGILEQSNVVYSNGNGEIWHVNSPG
jgi:uncharacterized membrane protein